MIVEINDLNKSFTQGSTEITIFKEMNFKIEKPGSIAIIGKSGSGKTTLLSLLSGMEFSDSGSVKLLGRDLKELSNDELSEFRAHNYSVIFQQFHLLPMLTALENVIIALEIKKIPNPVQVAKECLDEVGLSHRYDHLPHELSGGECQRVALARAIATKPKILFADEPSGNLDETTGQDVTQLMFDLVSKNETTLFLVTHDPALANKCEAVYRLNDHKLVQEK
jgi:putative ABC transport system ATP-binding protein